MADVVSKEKRSQMMSGIRGKDTGIEVDVRRFLHKSGLRFRLHARDLPGRPDIVLPKYEAVVEVNGCFWHRHDCQLFRLPGSNTDFWEKKLNGNRERDVRNREALERAGWRVLTVWECAMKLTHASDSELSDLTVGWVRTGNRSGDIKSLEGNVVLVETTSIGDVECDGA